MKENTIDRKQKSGIRRETKKEIPEIRKETRR
jgi:hypothetical protein